MEASSPGGKTAPPDKTRAARQSGTLVARPAERLLCLPLEPTVFSRHAYRAGFLAGYLAVRARRASPPPDRHTCPGAFARRRRLARAPSTMKKLPFKPTALRRPSVPRPASGEDDAKPDADDDGLALFRRSKEMEPIMAADRERRLKKRQRQDDERRRQSLLLAEPAREEDHCGPSPRTDSFDQPPSAPPPSTPVVDLSGPGDEEDSTRCGPKALHGMETTHEPSADTLQGPRHAAGIQAFENRVNAVERATAPPFGRGGRRRG